MTADSAAKRPSHYFFFFSSFKGERRRRFFLASKNVSDIVAFIKCSKSKQGLDYFVNDSMSNALEIRISTDLYTGKCA